jgi:hypothetical protein
MKKKEDECDIYIVEFIHDATKNYYERGKYGCWNSHVTKTPLFEVAIVLSTHTCYYVLL